MILFGHWRFKCWGKMFTFGLMLLQVHELFIDQSRQNQYRQQEIDGIVNVSLLKLILFSSFLLYSQQISFKFWTSFVNPLTSGKYEKVPFILMKVNQIELIIIYFISFLRKPQRQVGEAGKCWHLLVSDWYYRHYHVMMI